MKNTFKFWCPLDISKAKNEAGEDVMRLGGIASTIDKDSDGEFLDPSGFEISDFKKSGVVNWHHQSSSSPATIIGEPHKAEIRKEGFYVETDLYPSSSLAKEVYELAMTLSRDSKTRRLGYSIEGTVIERDETNPKIVKSAKITGLAITHMPKNAQTFADIIKGHVFEEDEEEKALDTTSGAALTKESVDGYKIKNVSKEDMYDKIFDTFPGISIEKAESVFEFFNKIDIAMAKGKEIKNQDLKKAMEHLGLDGELKDNPFLEKSEGAKATEETVEKAMSADEVAQKIDKQQFGDKETDSDSEEDEDENEDKTMKKGKEDNLSSNPATDLIVKAIEAGNAEQTANVRALARLVKSQSDQIDIMKGQQSKTQKELSDTKQELSKAIGSINEFASQSEGRKSITKGYVERKFEGQEELKKGNNSLSLSQNKKQIINILDGLAFSKGGQDLQFSKAVMSLEAGSTLPDGIISRLKTEHGIEIVQ